MSDHLSYEGIWRNPAEETSDRYPGLVVCDGRVSGSITLGASRMPIWAFIADLVHAGWDTAVENYAVADYGWSPEQLTGFLVDLLEMRGEFARLLLTLAEAERNETERDEAAQAGLGPVIDLLKHPGAEPWWQHQPSRQAVREQLQQCLDCLDALEAE